MRERFFYRLAAVRAEPCLERTSSIMVGGRECRNKSVCVLVMTTDDGSYAIELVTCKVSFFSSPYPLAPTALVWNKKKGKKTRDCPSAP